jgi:malate dehydrogenase (oxaloacetate-decarboxylating)
MQPTVLIGLSTAHGAFHEQLVRGMMAAVQRPIIFPLSNPTSRSEADPADLWRWTDGRALIATGSPYPPLRVDGVSVPVAQSNNVFVFPGLGLGAIAARATQVTDGMLQAAATALGALSPILAGSNRPLLPPIPQLRDSSIAVASAVARAAVADGVAPEVSDERLATRVRDAQWTPRYLSAAQPASPSSIRLRAGSWYDHRKLDRISPDLIRFIERAADQRAQERTWTAGEES